MSGLVDGWSRREARGHGIALLAALLVSRIVTGKLQLSLRPVEIGSVVTAAIGTVTPAANAKSVLIQLIQDPAGSAVMGDRNRLQQVFWNLLSNAVKLSEERPGPGERSVRRLAGRGRGLRHGLGIDATFLPHVFNRFSQRDCSSTRSARGLGLAIARQLVELHGGSIRAESPGAGQGSTFTVDFPVPPSRPSRPTGVSTRRRTGASVWTTPPTSRASGC